MRINPSGSIKRIDTDSSSTKKAPEPEKGTVNVKDTYMPSQKESKIGYTRSLSAVNRDRINELKEESQRTFNNLRQLVEQLLKEQGMTYKQAEDGELSAEKVSERIVEFAKALAGEDKSKLAMLRGAIEKGFSEAERILNGLPEVSRQTHDLVMEKLDNWSREE